MVYVQNLVDQGGCYSPKYSWPLLVILVHTSWTVFTPGRYLGLSEDLQNKANTCLLAFLSVNLARHVSQARDELQACRKVWGSKSFVVCPFCRLTMG